MDKLGPCKFNIVDLSKKGREKQVGFSGERLFSFGIYCDKI